MATPPLLLLLYKDHSTMECLLHFVLCRLLGPPFPPHARTPSSAPSHPLSIRSIEHYAATERERQLLFSFFLSLHLSLYLSYEDGFLRRLAWNRPPSVPGPTSICAAVAFSLWLLLEEVTSLNNIMVCVTRATSPRLRDLFGRNGYTMGVAKTDMNDFPQARITHRAK